MSDITVRAAAAEDLPYIGALNRGALPAVSDVTEPELRHLVDAAVMAAVAVADDAIVGFLIALGPGVDYASPNYRFFADRYPEFAYIDRVVVSPGWQRRGVGAALYDALEEQVRGHAPLITCEVNVRPRNDTSLAFHAARGFAMVGEQDTDGGAKRVRLLVRELSAET